MFERIAYIVVKRLFVSLIAVLVLATTAVHAQSTARGFTSTQVFTTASHPISLSIPLPLSLMMKLTNSNTSLPKKVAPKDKNVIVFLGTKPKPAPTIITDTRKVNVSSSAVDKRIVFDAPKYSLLYAEKTIGDPRKNDPHFGDVVVRDPAHEEALPPGPARHHGFGEWP